MKIGSERAERLDRDDAAGADVGAAKQRLATPQDGVVGRARQQAEQAAFALEEAADGPGDREGPVSIGHGGKDLAGELLGKERRPFGLAARTDAAGAATEGEQVLTLASRAANSCEASV